MPRFSSEVMGKLRKLDLVKMVSEVCELSGNGKEQKAICPFPDHTDAAPSFMVNTEKNMFFCHGCQEGGGPVQFIMNMWNFSFEQAVKYLCEKHGIPLSGEQYDDEQHYKIMETLVTTYQEILWKEKPARAWDYLKLQRGLTEKTIEEFKIGATFDDQHFSIVFDVLRESFSEEALLQVGVGLISEFHEKPVDYFRSRIVWPIEDISGRPIAMAGRTISEDNPVKYINSPDTPIFSKKRVLFNLHRGQPAATSEREVIIFEDYFSIFMSWQHGIKNTLSTMGTAFGEVTANICSRITNNGTVFICLDPDKAGDKASISMATSLMNNNSQTKLIRLPKDEDPDEVIRYRGVDEFLKFKQEAKDPFSFLASYFEDYDLSTVDGHLKAVEDLSSIMKMIDNGVTRNIVSDKLKKEVGIESQAPMKNIAKNFKAETVSDIPSIEIEFLGCLVQFPELKEFLENIDPYSLTPMSKVIFDLVKLDQLDTEASVQLSGFIIYLKNLEIINPEETFTEAACWININSGQKYLAETLELLKVAVPEDKQRLTNEYLELLGGLDEQSTLGTDSD